MQDTKWNVQGCVNGWVSDFCCIVGEYRSMKENLCLMFSNWMIWERDIFLSSYFFSLQTHSSSAEVMVRSSPYINVITMLWSMLQSMLLRLLVLVNDKNAWFTNAQIYVIPSTPDCTHCEHHCEHTVHTPWLYTVYTLPVT